MLNNHMKIMYYSKPYPIWVIDNFLNEDYLKSIKDSWPSLDSNVWHSGYSNVNGKKNILEQKMRAISKIEDMPNEIQDFFSKVQEDSFLESIEKITKLKDLIPDDTMRWSGMRQMLPGAFQLIHSDARKHPINGLRKELTALLYLNETHYSKEKCEGCLEVWSDDMLQRVYEIEPLDNRFVLFLNTETSYHGVPKVSFHRKALTFSIMKEGDSSERSKALFVKRQEDSQEVEEIGKERAYIKSKF